MPEYKKIPILESARRCGLVLNQRTLRRGEVEASCPFCGDHGAGKYHLFLNTSTDQYHCILCNASGNSVTLYARVKGLTNREAFLELDGGGRLRLEGRLQSRGYTKQFPDHAEERVAYECSAMALEPEPAWAQR